MFEVISSCVKSPNIKRPTIAMLASMRNYTRHEQAAFMTVKILTVKPNVTCRLLLYL